MSAEPPSSTQQCNPDIFLYSRNAQIPIFIEASAIPNRPKLIRLLRNSGALLSHDPAAADIILVKSESGPGRQFIREWGKDPAKSVLEYTWVKKCVQVGKALLQGDKWGSMQAYDDGGPIHEHNDGEAAEKSDKSPLPTPRPTPTENGRRRSSVHVEHSVQDSDPEPDMQAGPSFTQPSHTQQSNQTIQHPPPQPFFPQQYQQQQYPQPFQQMPFYPHPQLIPNNTMSPFPQPQMSQMYSPQVAIPANLQDMFFQFLQQNTQLVPSQPQPPASFNGLPQQQTQIDSHSATPQAPGPHSSSSPTIPPSISRRRYPLSSTPSPPPSSGKPRKGKGRAGSSSYRSHKRQRSESSDDERSASPEYLPDTHMPALSPRKPGKIFVSDSGRPLLFFIQIEYKGRKDLAMAIKLNGGKMLGEIKGVDYVILANAGTNHQAKGIHKTLHAQTKGAGLKPIRPSFVNDCISEQALLEIDDYTLEEGQEATPSRPIKAIKVEAKENKMTPKTEKQEKKKAKSTPVKPAIQEPASFVRNGAGSPTPPPSRDRTATSLGFSYTDAENAYAKKYVRFLIESDLDITKKSIGTRLHEKLPHHSASSWETHIARNHPNLIESARKTVGIAQRKVARIAQVDSTLPDNHNSHAKAQEQDFDAICDFFAKGIDGSGSSDESDEAVWAALHSYQPCKSAASWPVFYVSRQESIEEAINKRFAAYQDGSRN